MKLTTKQREWLEWVRDAGGVTDVSDRRIANPLSLRGFVSYDMGTDTWSITPAGRLALSEKADARREGE